MKKIISIILSLAMISALAVPAMATNRNESTNYSADELALLDTDDVTVFYLDDGTKITVAVLPSVYTLSAGYEIESGWARPSVTHSYTCNKDSGSHLRAETNNIGTNSMRVTVVFNRDPQYTQTKIVPADDRFLVVAHSNNGTGLTLQVDTTIAAYNSTSAHYSYSITQD